MESSSSPSRLGKLYRSSKFRRIWDNDISFHVAENAIYLRRLRGKSQGAVAKAMGTSQPAIARIEGGDENITLRTLRRLATALHGRIRFAIEPEERNLPQMPAWWEMVESGLSSTSPWVFQGAEERDIAAGRALGTVWCSAGLVHSEGGPITNDTLPKTLDGQAAAAS